MAVLSKLVAAGTIFLLALNGVTAARLPTRMATVKHLLSRDDFEWTALGDSYSSGVGAGDYISNSYRCLRYSQAYPNLMNDNDNFGSGSNKVFHDAVCSGSDTQDVEAYQFYDQDTSGQPNLQYGDRPRFGAPRVSTLSVGGNDIDFPGIIFNCILETNLPFGAGPPARSCDDQRKFTQSLLDDPSLVDKIDNLIKKTVTKGQQGQIGDNFKLYVTGFPQFFSVETDECDKVTFARTANPVSDGKEHVMMTQALRSEFNAMSVQLNQAIQDAVSRNGRNGVTWIPIDDVMEGHRFCEPGIAEPDQKNPNLWLFHYPYNEPQDDATNQPLLDAYNNVTANTNVNDAYPSYHSFEKAMFEAVDLPGDPSVSGIFDWFWRWVGDRVKVFHPQPPLHQQIRDKVLDAYFQDIVDESGVVPIA